MQNNDWAYFDYTATTPVDPQVLDEYIAALKHNFVNTGGAYELGYQNAAIFDQCCVRFANCIGVDACEIVFTSGATESDNLALKGAALYHGAKNPRIVTLQTEHKAILDPLVMLTKEGVKIDVLPVLPSGLLDLGVLKEALKTPATLVSVMAVNNETGVCQPIREIADIVHQSGSKLHVDAAQALGKMPVNVSEWDADMVSFSGHKIYAPKGIGALYVRRLPKMRIASQIHGGGQQYGRRAGTIDLPLIMAFTKALEIVVTELSERRKHVQMLQNQLVSGLPNPMHMNIVLETVPHVPHIISIDSREKAIDLLAKANNEHIAFSAGSACQSAESEGSHVLKAMGLAQAATESIRVSLSHLTTTTQIDRLLNFLRSRHP